ncbi:MAG: hypothetical protein ACXW5U_22985 [Thermoanaerobaculia bacterium]
MENDAAELDEPAIETLRDAEQALRFIVGSPPRQGIVSDTRRWNTICAALDVIGDTESALDAYLDAPSTGHPYINAYGVLQALYLQQDAVRHLFEAHDIKFTFSAALKEIRQTRNETIGHPTNVGYGQASVIIVQITVDAYGFDYNRETADGKLTTHHVALRSLIEEQRTSILSSLQALYAELKHEWLVFMKEHSKTKLWALLPKTWSYHAGNLWRALENPEGAVFGQIDLQMLLEPVLRIEEELLRRSEPLERWEPIESRSWSVPRLRHALERLRHFFAGRAENFAKRDAEIFIIHVQEQLKRLDKGLADLDAEYEEAARQE